MFNHSEIILTLDDEYDTPTILCFPNPGVGPFDEMNSTKNELVKVIDEMLEMKRQRYRLINTTEYLHELKRGAYLGERRRLACYSGYYVVNVYWDGSVTPCFNKSLICNVRDFSIIHQPKENCQLCLNQCFAEFSHI